MLCLWYETPFHGSFTDKHHKPNLFLLRYEETGPERGEVTPAPQQGHTVLCRQSLRRAQYPPLESKAVSLVFLGPTEKGHPRWMGDGGEFWQKVAHWRRNGKPLQYSCLENPMKVWKGKKYDTTRWTPQVGRYSICYWRSYWINSSRKNEETEPKQKQHPVVDVTDDGGKVRCYKEQYRIGTWNVRSMNQGKLKVVKQEMPRVNINTSWISELKRTGMGEFNSDDHYIYHCGQESLRRKGVAHIVNKRVRNAVLGCNLKNDRKISVGFQGEPFNIKVI